MTASQQSLAVVSADREGLDGLVGQHFGRCPAYTLVELDASRVVSTKVVDNPFVSGHQPGDVPGFIAGLGADVLLAGGIGGRAIQFFEDLGVRVSSGHAGTVRDAVAGWITGSAGGAEPCKHPDHEEGHGHDHERCGRHA